jgi:hypothetical protein
MNIMPQETIPLFMFQLRINNTNMATVRTSDMGRLWCGVGGMCTGGWTKGLLLVENSMMHQGVTLLHTD